MKVKLLRDGKIYVAKRWKDMTLAERMASVGNHEGEHWEDNSIFIEPRESEPDCWHYMFDREVEIIEETESEK